MDTETAEEIMRATYRALSRHGYADLTMNRIAEESSMTSGALHYHFNTKGELLNAFLQYLVDQFREEMACEDSDPRTRLSTFLDAVFARPPHREDTLSIALMVLKAQAPYQDSYREQLLELDEEMSAVVRSAVRDGVEAGQFDDADPDLVARFVVTAVNGGHVREVALGEDPERTRAMVERVLERSLGWSPEVVS